MGIIKAVVGAIGGGLADQWIEVLEADNMGQGTVFTSGLTVRPNDKRSSNTKGTEDVITDGSIIHVYDNQFMILVDGGKVVDYTAEPGYYEVKNSSAPSLFNGDFGDALKETFSRIKFAGVPSVKQKAFFINLQEIKGIKFGTRNPINYFDTFYNSELFLRAHGTYSIKITDPLKFYQEVVPRNASRVEIDDVNEQYLNEFLEALQAAINQMSADGGRISHVTSKARELSKYMGATLDEEWNQLRGMEVLAVGLGSISYDEESQKLINMRNQGAMLGDPSVREGYVQGAIARGLESAGSNEGGAAAAFMGMGIGMNATGGAAAAFTQSNQSQIQQAPVAQAANGWTCVACSAVNSADAKFCSKCGAKKPEANPGWACTNCNANNNADAKFCANCGNKKPEAGACPGCGAATSPGAKFCPGCGQKL